MIYSTRWPLSVRAGHVCRPPIAEGSPSLCLRGMRVNRQSGIQCKERDQPERVHKQEESTKASRNVDPMTLLQGSTVFYGAMTVSAIFLGRAMGLQVLEDLSGPVDILGGLLWTLPMVVSLFVTVAVTDRYPALVRIRTILQSTLIPVLRRMPGWGPIVLAVGAGIGEEALFRGWMQPAITQKLIEFSPQYASVGGVLMTSLLFGLGHAVTQTYFVWASVFGVFMGVECVLIGLPATAFTHALYDWVAFVSLKELWKPQAENTDVSSDK